MISNNSGIENMDLDQIEAELKLTSKQEPPPPVEIPNKNNNFAAKGPNQISVLQDAGLRISQHGNNLQVPVSRNHSHSVSGGAMGGGGGSSPLPGNIVK